MPPLEYLWMPFTANREFKKDPKLFVRAEGMHYWDQRGRRIVDGCSGLFSSAAGHCRPEIARAVSRELMELDYAPSFMRGHPLAFRLAEKLAALLPEGMDRIFLVDSGSEAVDSAMKICLAYHRARGDGSRTLFVSRDRAFHGVNIGGLALSGIGNNRRAIGALTGNVVHMRHTLLDGNRFSKGSPKDGAELAEELQRLIDLHGGENIAACFVEPIAGSTGVLVPPKGYLNRLHEICERHNIILVFDEVICGFGRTGKAFASQTFGVTPDIITMAKAITNGALPMGAVAVKREIYETVLAEAPEDAIELFHGYTASGHPAVCAAALSALEIYEREGLFMRGEKLAPYFLDSIFALSDLRAVRDIRGLGMIAGIELASDDIAGRRGNHAQKALFDAGLHVKATGDSLIIAPALIAEKGHIDDMCTMLRRVLAEC